MGLLKKLLLGADDDVAAKAFVRADARRLLKEGASYKETARITGLTMTEIAEIDKYKGKKPAFRPDTSNTPGILMEEVLGIANQKKSSVSGAQASQEMNNTFNTARKLIRAGNVPHDVIAKMLGLPVETVRALAMECKSSSTPE